jgi:NAD(P)-dependent dehydrogenase (short-subunit alcohol dehydrogenase family)
LDLGLRGKVGVVTGGASGIGRQTAQLLAEEGVRLLVVDQNVEGIQETIQEIEAKGGEAKPFPLDVRDYPSCERLPAAAAEHFGGLDILVNAAGVGRHGLFLESDPNAWSLELDVNLRGVMNCSRAIGPTLVRQRYGKIVNIASEAGKVGEKRIAVYAASKGGVISFTKSLAVELGRFGVNVNAVCPGVTKTPMTAYLTPEQEAEWSKYYPLGRLGVPEDIAPMIAFLCSDRASWITGQAISINGGFGRS